MECSFFFVKSDDGILAKIIDRISKDRKWTMGDVKLSSSDAAWVKREPFTLCSIISRKNAKF